ncbi:hypothetical protein C8Q80DRAFT_1341559 [Daedaleopsis nitida]|nr:hypothetical protein C8Q80DRAFT_1341559 [Daedaleopsis nitida]
MYWSTWSIQLWMVEVLQTVEELQTREELQMVEVLDVASSQSLILQGRKAAQTGLREERGGWRGSRESTVQPSQTEPIHKAFEDNISDFAQVLAALHHFTGYSIADEHTKATTPMWHWASVHSIHLYISVLGVLLYGRLSSSSATTTSLRAVNHISRGSRDSYLCLSSAVTHTVQHLTIELRNKADSRQTAFLGVEPYTVYTLFVISVSAQANSSEQKEFTKQSLTCVSGREYLTLYAATDITAGNWPVTKDMSDQTWWEQVYTFSSHDNCLYTIINVPDTTKLPADINVNPIENKNLRNLLTPRFPIAQAAELSYIFRSPPLNDPLLSCLSTIRPI